jgi:hypothetical protein
MERYCLFVQASASAKLLDLLTIRSISVTAAYLDRRQEPSRISFRVITLPSEKASKPNREKPKLGHAFTAFPQ